MKVLPPVPNHAVDRPEVRALLDLGLEAPLSLVVAPAGSGKTVLLSQWAANLQDVDVVWLELAAADEAVQLTGRLLHDLRDLRPGFGALDGSHGREDQRVPGPELETLVVAFADLPRQVVVVFDDVDLLGKEALSILWRLVDRLPPRVHFVFSSRVDLRLGWSRHRLQHGLIEIRAPQLALTEGPAAELLDRIVRRPVDPGTVAAIVRRMEGWAAGVQLAGLWLRRTPETPGLGDSDRLAIDYLSEEVFDAQTPERRRTLLVLSVLDEMSADIVEAVAGIDNGATFLRDLERESLFVARLPGVAERYRFHPLFRDLLRLRLRATGRATEVEVLRRAAAFHRWNGAAGDEIECLLAAGDWDEAIDQILASGSEVYERGDASAVARWLAQIPQNVMARRPDAVVIRGIAEGRVGRATIGESLLRSVISSPGVPIGIELIARSYASAGVQFHSPAERYLEDGHRMLAVAENTADPNPPDLLQITSLPMLRTIAMVSIGRAHLFLGDLDKSGHWLRRAIVSEGANYVPFHIQGLGSLALCDALAGRLRTATASADEALDLARETTLLSHPAPADAYLARALVAIQRGWPESGALALHEGYLRAASNNRSQLMWIAHAASRLVDPQGTDVAAMPPHRSASQGGDRRSAKH